MERVSIVQVNMGAAYGLSGVIEMSLQRVEGFEFVTCIWSGYPVLRDLFKFIALEIHSARPRKPQWYDL